MRTLARVALGATLATVAFVAGRDTGPRDRAGPVPPTLTDFQARARVTSWGRGHKPPGEAPERYELVPYRVLIDGRRVLDTLDGQPKTGDVWQIDLADGRIVILATRAPDPD